MPTVERVRHGLTARAAMACAVPAGVLSGAGGATTGAWLPGVAVALTAAAGGAWWWTSRQQHRSGCAGTCETRCAGG
jgi:hypothetical protein